MGDEREIRRVSLVAGWRIGAGDFHGLITWYWGSLLRRVLLWRLADPAVALLPSPAPVAAILRPLLLLAGDAVASRVQAVCFVQQPTRDVSNLECFA